MRLKEQRDVKREIGLMFGGEYEIDRDLALDGEASEDVIMLHATVSEGGKNMLASSIIAEGNIRGPVLFLKEPDYIDNFQAFERDEAFKLVDELNMWL